jgi:hypothetical protein
MFRKLFCRQIFKLVAGTCSVQVHAGFSVVLNEACHDFAQTFQAHVGDVSYCQLAASVVSR